MRVAFFGTPRAAVPSLEALARSAHDVVVVVTQPDRGSGRRLAPRPVKDAAEALGVPTWQPGSVGTASFRAELAARAPDVLVVVAYGRIFGPKLLALAPHGAVNVHFSLLPRWRGAAPVQRCILAGDAETGVTTMRLVRELDAGPMLQWASVGVDETDHAPVLEARLAALGARLVVTTLDGLAAGSLEAVEQDHALATLAPPLSKAERWLDPRRPAQELARRVRALDPWPGAWLAFSNAAVRAVRVVRATVGDGAAAAAPGTVLPAIDEALPVACADGRALLVERARPADRGEMRGRSLLDGRLLTVGDVATAPPDDTEDDTP